MSWLLLDDQILRHPKFVRAQRLSGSTAFHLWVGLTAYCKQQQSDGRVPSDMIETVDGPDKRWRSRALKALLEVRLVEYEGDDLWVHDFLDWNASRQEIEAKAVARRAGRAHPPGIKRTSKERRTERIGSVGPNVVGASNLELGDLSKPANLNATRKPPNTNTNTNSNTNGSPLAPLAADPSPAAPTSASKKKSSHRVGKRICPADFEPDAATLKVADELGYSEALERATRPNMIDWSIGKHVEHANWQATYRNWLRKDARDRGLKPVKHDAQWAHHQAQLRKANAPVKVAPVQAEVVATVRNLFGG
jgi:hypothetical protein